jgi:hypothetical protein
MPIGPTQTKHYPEKITLMNNFTLTRRGLLKALLHTLAAGAAAAVGGHYYSTKFEPNRLVVERVDIPIKGLHPDLHGFRIAQLSDIHLHPYTRLDLVQAAVAHVNQLQPDLVLLTGDYVLESAHTIFDLAPVLATLTAGFGVLAGIGNHDLWTNADIVHEGLTQAGIPLLRNSGRALEIGRAVLFVAGLDDGWSGRPNLDTALAARPAGAATVLMFHEPDLADAIAPDGRINLQLSGHSHGGQVRLPGLGAPILPYLGQKYDQGLYSLRDMWLYTNRGLGVVGPPVRFNCPPEVTDLTLTGV